MQWQASVNGVHNSRSTATASHDRMPKKTFAFGACEKTTDRATTTRYDGTEMHAILVTCSVTSSDHSHYVTEIPESIVRTCRRHKTFTDLSKGGSSDSGSQ